MVPSSGGGTKLIRTLRVGEGFGLGAGGVGVVDGASWANVAQSDINPTKRAAVSPFVMPSGVEPSFAVLQSKPDNFKGFLDFTALRSNFVRNDIKCNNASLHSGKGYRAIRNRAEILHRHDLR
jgi:hypothetical protein